MGQRYVTDRMWVGGAWYFITITKGQINLLSYVSHCYRGLQV